MLSFVLQCINICGVELQILKKQDRSCKLPIGGIVVTGFTIERLYYTF